MTPRPKKNTKKCSKILEISMIKLLVSEYFFIWWETALTATIPKTANCSKTFVLVRLSLRLKGILLGHEIRKKPYQWVIKHESWSWVIFTPKMLENTEKISNMRFLFQKYIIENSRSLSNTVSHRYLSSMDLIRIFLPNLFIWI